MSKGKLLVLEGLDGSGKATQAKLLAAHLAGSGRRVMEVTFPDYESDSSALVKMYLSGQFGSRPDDVNPYAASSFYAVDRYASYKTKWGSFYEAGGIVIADRYTTSNAVHQCSKLPPDQWDGFLRWAFGEGESCRLCGATDVYLDELVDEETGETYYQCNDTAYCQQRREEGRNE